jgi:diguanylate cyclase (GGDEF)-like protein
MIEARTDELERSNQQLAELNSKLEMASHTDTLTSLHNRRYLNNWLDLINQQQDQELPVLQVILIDLDNFKQINDNYGHLVGDEILVAMAKLLKQEIRNTDHVVRWGGEEFLVIQENSLSSKEFVTRLERKIAAYQWPHHDQLIAPVSCSMGVVTHPAIQGSNWNWDATLTLADKALYLVKSHGKSGWLQITPKLSAPADLAVVMSNYSEIALVKTDWFSLDGSPKTVQLINEHCRE